MARKAKKSGALHFLVFTPVLLGLAIIAVIAGCATTTVYESGIRDGVLFKYTRFENGRFGYDFNTPVTYNARTGENIIIPDVFIPQKHQFRAAWVATVFSMNFPVTTSENEFKREYLRILDTLTDWKMNAVIFQVSPLLDAFWSSEHRPWSQHVTGIYEGPTLIRRQGINPGWDPLKWMIAETHKRGLEFHAWFNPYRVTATRYRNFTIPGKTKEDLDVMTPAQLVVTLNQARILADNNFAVLNPEYNYVFNECLALDPGIPAVRQHVIDTIAEVVKNYDVDAIHFDDYFYPYAVSGLLFGTANEDRNTFLRYRGQFPDTRDGIEAWRRDNNDKMIQGVKDAITAENKANNRAIQFGISPFGIWANHSASIPQGSITSGSQTFVSQVYADTRKWVLDEMVDYIIPQIYWAFDMPAAPYGELARWWSSLVEGKNVDLYIGHANYKHIQNGGVDPAWMNPREILHQLRFNQLYPQIKGNVFFSYTSLLHSEGQEPRHRMSNESARILRDHYQRHHTLVPPKPWLKNTAPAAPVRVIRESNNRISWTDAEDNDTRYYVVYRVPSTTALNDIESIINNPFNIAARVWRDGESGAFTDRIRNPNRYNYIVTAVNAAHIESVPVIAGR
jgi:uncharacterized lipoprotein YddW (UPF0748 family)